MPCGEAAGLLSVPQSELGVLRRGWARDQGFSRAGSPPPSASAAVGGGDGSDLPCPHIPLLSLFPSLCGRPVMLMFIPAKKYPLNPFFPQVKSQPVAHLVLLGFCAGA